MGRIPQWQSVSVDAFIGGLNTAQRSEMLANDELVTCNNVVLRQGKVQVDTGYQLFGTAVRGSPQTDYQYFSRTGISALILITTETVYIFNSAASEWQYIPGTVHTTVSTQANAGATSIVVASISGFVNGQHVGIKLDNGVQHQTTISGTPSGNTIVILDAIPTGRYAPVNASAVAAITLTGDLDSQVSVVPVPSNDWLVFTNGLNLPMYFDGTYCLTLPNLPANFESCKAVIEYNSSLFMLNTVEAGLNFPQRVRRTDIGDPTNWSTNLAGYDDLYDGVDIILGGELMGPYLIIYRERSIVRGSYVNTGGKIYQWDTTLEGEGVVSTQAVVNLNAKHILFANAGIFSYTGGYDIDSIGDKIFYKIYSNQGDLNTSYKNRVFSFYVEELDECWFFYPAGESAIPNTLLRYNVGDDNWSIRTFADGFTGYGFYQTITAHRWVDLVGSWAAQNWRWNSRTVSTDSPTTHLMGGNLTQVVEYNYYTADDNGVAITAVVETKDFFNKDYSIRFDSLECYCKGVDVLVEYSIDSGVHFQAFDGLLSASTMTIFNLSRQVICDKIRFRFTSSNPGFELDYITFTYREEANRLHRGS
jgi:hypothetical protein